MECRSGWRSVTSCCYTDPMMTTRSWTGYTGPESEASPQVHTVRIDLLAKQAEFFFGWPRSDRQGIGHIQGKPRIVEKLVELDAGMDGNHRGCARRIVEPENRHVGNDTARATAAKAQLLPAVPTDEAGAGEVRHRSRELPFSVAHNDNNSVRQRRHVVAAGAA